MRICTRAEEEVVGSESEDAGEDEAEADDEGDEA